MFEDFYYVIEGGSVFDVRNNGFDVKPEEICILQSILRMYHTGHKCFDERRFLPVFKRAKQLMIDSGGFNILRRYPDYPFSINEYNTQLNSINPDYAVSMDYSTIMLKDIIGDEYKDRLPYLIKTIDNYVEQYDMERNYKLLIGLQGNDIDEKIGFMDMVSDRMNLNDVDYWGIGGITITGSVELMNINLNLRTEITNYLNKRLNNPKIHHFGLSIAHLKKLFKYNIKFTSLDSRSWEMPIQFGRTFDDNGTVVRIKYTKQSTNEVRQRSLYNYIKKIEKLKKLYETEYQVEGLF